MLKIVVKYFFIACMWVIKTCWHIIVALFSAITFDDDQEGRSKEGEIGVYHDRLNNEVHSIKRSGGMYLDDD
jgi:hypothetical protein